MVERCCGALAGKPKPTCCVVSLFVQSVLSVIVSTQHRFGNAWWNVAVLHGSAKLPVAG